MRNRPISPRGLAGQDLFTGIEFESDGRSAFDGSRDVQIAHVRGLFATRSPKVLEAAEEAIRGCTNSAELLLLAALVALALALRLPARALTLLKRHGKRFEPNKAAAVLTALALGQQDKLLAAWTILEAEGLTTDTAAQPWFVGDELHGDLALRTAQGHSSRTASYREAVAGPSERFPRQAGHDRHAAQTRAIGGPNTGASCGGRSVAARDRASAQA